MMNVNSGFPVRAKLGRWLMAGVIAFWALGSSAMPLMPMPECRDMAPIACAESMHHAATPHHQQKVTSPNHECCKKKPAKQTPKKAEMPACPMHEGLLPRTCGPVEMSCCALMSREETRRSAQVEKKKGDDSQKASLERSPSDGVRVAFDTRDRHLRDGSRFEKPVFDLKTDLRI